MEQDVEQGYSTICATCLSTDRDLFSLAAMPQMYEIFRWIIYDAAGPLDSDMTQLICWECLAMLKKINRFKWQVNHAQDSLRVLALSQNEAMDHTYISQSLSNLVIETKSDYDKILFDYSSTPDCVQFVNVEGVDNHMEHIGLDIDDHMLEVPEIILENSTSVFSHIVVDTSSFIKTEGVGSMRRLTIEPLKLSSNTDTVPPPMVVPKVERPELKLAYTVECMSDADMIATREECKKKVHYASSVFKCELCIIGFYTQQQVEEHFETAHRAKPGYESCKVCYVYVPLDKLQSHTDQHYTRYVCKLCARVEHSEKMIEIHTDTHMGRSKPPALIQIEGHRHKKNAKDKKRKSAPESTDPPKPGDLRKLLSKTTIEGYKCLECDMFFKTSRARKNHVARFHREGLQCDHCKKRFVNKTTLATHLRLHEGPLPREECPICRKMVRSIQIKYHIQRHQNKSRYECTECNKIFSHLATYHAHLKYSRRHASDQVFKFPCPMCNKGYPTKEAMQDHFNYQHLGKTSHKCPICNKPIASRANVEKHIARVHSAKKERPRNHVCQTCGKPFTDKKALTQHEVIHSGARPLSCDICHHTFKQKASLYTHRKRVHKIFPQKKEVKYMNDTVTS